MALNEQDFYQQFLNEERANLRKENPEAPLPPGMALTQNAPQKQTIVIGGQNFEYGNPAELQAIVERQTTLMNAEMRARGVSQVSQVPQVVQAPQQAQQGPPPLPAHLDVEKYASILKENPALATDLAFANAMQLPEGTRASQVLSTIVGAITTLGNRNEEQAKQIKELRDAAETNALKGEITRFHQMAGDDFFATRANAALLEKTRNELGLDATAEGYRSAYRVAKAEGAPFERRPGDVQLPQQGGGYQPQQGGYAPQAQQRVGVPQIGGGQGTATGGGQAQDQLEAYLNSLPYDKAMQVIAQMEGKASQFGR